MPMDNDDNDTTHHNLQLAGEGRARFSPTLRPYDFPKFDFDDNLQGHLRFDSLVETEVFLGIQSQEDNQWIEDFSRGSNGMEFNSTPADSCSIHRRNNVWSEATSSESVEMLLKSVGQEDTRPGTSIVPELDATAQGTLSELVESSNNNTERKDRNDTSATNFDTTLQPGIVLEGNLASSRHMEEQVENPSVSHPMDDFPCENSGTFTNEGIHLHHAESTSELVELKTSVEKTLDERDTLSFPSVTDAVDSDIGMLSTSKDCEQFNFSVPHENFISDGQEKHVFSKTAPEESATLQGKTGVTNTNTNSVVVSFGLAPGSGSDSQEASIVSGRESVDNLIKGEFVLKSSEGDDTNTRFTTSTQTVRPENALVLSDGLDNPTKKCQGGSSMDVIVPHSVELGNIISSGRSASSKKIIDPIVQLPCRRDDDNVDDDDVEDVSVSGLKPESVSERSLLSMKVNEASTTMDEDIGKAVVLSAVDHEHAENSLGGPQDTVATKELGVHLVADDTNVPMQDIQVNLDQSRDEFLEHDKDMCKTTVADKEVPSDIENADSRYIGTLGKYNQTQALEVREQLAGDYAIHNLQPQTSGKQESDNVSNFATTNSSTDYHEVEQSKPAAIGLLHPSNDQEEVGKSEANLHANVYNATEVEVSMAETSVVSQQHVEKSDNIPSSVPSLMTNENADLVNGGEIMDRAEERESGQITDFDKTFCGSPTIISSSEPSQIENNIQEKGRGYQVTNEVNGSQSTSEDLKRIDSLGDDSGFTFKVTTLPEPGKNWSPFPDVDKTKVLTESSPSSKGKTERMSSQKTPPQNAKVIDRETGSVTSKGTSERRGRRGSAKGTTKENVKKGNQSKGATTNKPSDTVAVTNLPDLNSSTSNTSSSFPFRQPFSDLQQVQLRAQIFVYGSLIQGSVPDEAYMVSAFGQYEGGRDFWERTWRIATERVQNQKSTTAAETPHSQSGARVSDAVKQGSHSSKVPVTPVCRTNSKETPAAVLSPIIPLSSPLWNISTPSQNTWTSNPLLKGPVTDLQHAHTPVHSYQTPPMRTFVGHTSWSLQTGFPSPWLASPHSSSFNLSAQFRPVTTTETVKLTPVKDTSVVVTSCGKHTTSSPAVHIVSPSPALGGVSPLREPKSITPIAPVSLDAKPRKRKKLPTPDPGQVTSVSEPQTGTKMISSVVSQPTIPVGTSTSASLSSDAMLSKAAADASTISSIELPQKSDLEKEKVVTCSEEMLSKVEEAKSKAEDAAALANAAVLHCEELWGQLAKHKDSGLTSESEAKVASSAAAVAASVSVAKAAAAAAKLACNAALQAKLMADEAVLSDRNDGMALCSDKSSDASNTGTATPSSILRSNNVTNQANSILVAAKEAAKRRVEAASVASRQAENLDAIVKAAELAAAVVSQVGKIVAMGEPLPLNDLIETGPEGCLKLPQPSVMLAEKLKDRTLDQSGAVTSDKTGGIPPCNNPSDSLEKRGSGTVGKDDVQLKEEPYGLSNACSLMSKHINEEDFRNEMDDETSDTSKIGIATPEIDTAMRSTNISSGSDDIAAQVVDGIKEGSCVEVFNPRSAQKSAWYTAKVLNVENGKAYVLYDYLFSEEGSVNVQEWVPLGSGEDKAPSIRIGHSLQHQKKGKRRRAALADRWCAGDRVDVWIDDCWWEGVVTEKKDNDETTFEVHISALGETLTVWAWNLRTSRSWINGKWIEWSSSKGQNTSEQSDTPQEKHRKLGSPILSESKDDEPNNLDSSLGNPEQSKLLNLSSKEIPFNIGKSTTTDNKQAARRTLRTNQQKEGSRVVFGVPKPTGKKRKFMEVSKHFSANKIDKSNEAKDTVKFAKYLMPQGAPSRGWKVPSRNDTKDKRIHESRPRVINTRKAQRTAPQREKSRSAQDAETPTDQGIDVEGSVSHDENTSNKSTEPVSAASEAPEAPLSSLLPQFQSTTSKKKSSLNSKPDRLNSGRLGPFGGKLSKTEEDKVYAANTGQSTLDVSEPRRSNRRIQPTHRLLEGLQNSMVIPKLPAVSHDKGHRNLPARGK